MAIIVTGSVGTGKTRLAKKIAKTLGYKYIDIHSLVKKNKIYDSYDNKRKCYIVDVKKLNKFLIKKINAYKKIIEIQLKEKNNRKKTIETKKKLKNKRTDNKKKIKKIRGIIIDSHLSHYLPKRYVELCIVTKCELKELKKRLEKRKYPENKIRENLDCEIFDVCLNETKEKGHKLLVVDATKGVNTEEIIKKFK